MRSQKLNLDTRSSDKPTEAIDATEARMRAALGLGTRTAPSGNTAHTAPPPAISHDQTRPRRRFAQDGDVPVVMLSRSRDTDGNGESRFAALTAELREEKSARARAERALDEASLSIQSLKTKLAHLEIACEEKLREERALREQGDTQRSADQEARKRAETSAAEAALALSMAERRIAELEAASEKAQAPAPARDLFGDTETPAAPRRGARRKSRAVAGEPAAAAEPEAEMAAESDGEDKPIEWWLPSFRAQRTAASSRKRKAR